MGWLASTLPCAGSCGVIQVTLPTYRANDRGKTVSLPVDARFSVELEENRTTGYRWSAAEFVPESLELVADDYIPGTSAGIGGGGTRRFEFVVKAIGKTSISLAYKRPWERKAPAQTYELNVVGTQ
jgi:inhibitor of cysteine peptidase